MKFRFLVALVCILSLFTFQAEAKKVKGTVFYENDTVTMTLHIPMTLSKIRYEWLERNISYYDKRGKQLKLVLDQVKQIKFKFKNELIVLCPILEEWKSELPMIKLVRVESNSIGEVQIYSYTDRIINPNNETYSEHTRDKLIVKRYFLVKGGLMTKVPDEKFQDFIHKYFTDCPELLKKVESKDLGEKHLSMIIDYYNSSCQ